jgi:hypothetical protein
MSTSPLAEQRGFHLGQRLFIAALLLLFLALSVKYSYKVLHNRSAFTRWQPQVLDLERGIDIAERHNYPNPPIMAVLLEPLALLPPLAGALTLFYLKVGMALAAYAWVFRLIETPDRPFPVWARVLTVLLSLKPILDDLNHGNVNLVILFLLVAALFAFSRRWDVLSGVILALAIACKLTPALFLPYFLWKRAWKTLLGIGLGLGLFLWPGLVPSLRLGFEDNQRQLFSWYRVMVQPFVLEGKVTSEHNNQSLPGLAARLLTPAPSFSTWIDNRYTPTRYDNFLELSAEQARRLTQAGLLLFALVVVGTCRTPIGSRTGWTLAAEYSLIVLGMLLFSERTWKHHAVTLILPVGVLCYVLAEGSMSRAGRTVLLVVLGLVFLLLLVTGLGTSHDDPWAAPDLAKLTQVYGAYTLAFLVLTGALAGLLWRQGQERQTRGSRLVGATHPGSVGTTTAGG